VGRRIVADHLQDIRETQSIDLAIANAENSAGGFGITPDIADELFALGLDVLTSGNHIWDKREIYEYFARRPQLLRPANYPDGTPGAGVVKVKRVTACNALSLICRADLYAVVRLPIPQGRPDSGSNRPKC
jgi:calcineurin-like phosphoesterase